MKRRVGRRSLARKGVVVKWGAWRRVVRGSFCDAVRKSMRTDLRRAVCGSWSKVIPHFARMKDCSLKDPSGLGG